MATQIKVYVIDPAVQLEVIQGDAPVDQTAEVAALTQQVAKLQGKLDDLAALANARKAADATTTEGQAELDIINAP